MFKVRQQWSILSEKFGEKSPNLVVITLMIWNLSMLKAGGGLQTPPPTGLDRFKWHGSDFFVN